MKTPTPLTDEQIEAVVDTNTTDDYGYDIWCNGKGVARTIEAARDAQWVEMLGKQEPVAWMTRFDDPERGSYGKQADTHLKRDEADRQVQRHIDRRLCKLRVEPLYTHPQPQPKQAAEPVAWRWKYRFKDIGETGAYEYHSHEFAVLSHMPKGEPLYTHPQPDDTALLRQALEALKEGDTVFYTKAKIAIAALEARLK